MASVVGIRHDAEIALMSRWHLNLLWEIFYDCFKTSCDAHAFVRPSLPLRIDADEHVRDVQGF